MRRTSALLYAGQIATAPLLLQRSNPDAVFERLYTKMRAEMDGFAFLEAPVAEGYRRRLRAYAATEGLSGLGWRIAVDGTAHRMGNRMRVARLHAAHPELAAVAIESPIIVVGLPRTGTTLAHNVLGRAQGCRGPELWEMFDMALPGSRTTEEEMRVQQRVDQTMRTHLKFSPDWDKIHPMRARSVEENAFLIDHSIMDLGTAPMPGYWEYLTGAYDAGHDWRFVKQALQVLSYRTAPRRWVLKHPGNLFYLPEIFEVFPDAQVVWTHRDPVTVLGSMCSMAESLHHLHMWAPRVDLGGIGAQWLKILPYGVAKARRDRVALIGGERPKAKRSANAFIDLPYARLMADPYAEVEQLYARLGLHWGAGETERLRAALQRPRDDKRHHDYGYRRYGGLTEERIDAAFGSYMGLVRSFNAQGRLE
jgi:hypothetical protein